MLWQHGGALRGILRRPTVTISLPSRSIQTPSSSVSNLRDTVPRERSREILHLKTLDPLRFVSKGQEVFRLISGISYKTMNIDRDDGKSTKISTHKQLFPIQFGRNTSPEAATGFLYFQPGRHSLEGWLRFRCCDSPAEFANGMDLKQRDGKLWGPTLVHLLHFRPWAPVIQMLVREGLVDKQVVQGVQAADLSGKNIYVPDTMLFSIRDTITITLNCRYIDLVTPTSVTQFSANIFHDLRPGLGQKFGQHPYKGVVSARFEISTFPEHARLGPTLCLKIVDIIKPIRCVIPKYDNYVECPRAGEYFRKGGQIWGYPLNNKGRRATWSDMLAADGIELPPLVTTKQNTERETDEADLK